MALTLDTVGRDNEGAGQTFLVFLDGSSRRIQSFAAVDENGAHSGVIGTPFVVVVDEPTTWKHDTVGTAENVVQLHNAAGQIRELRVLLDPAVINVRWFMLFDTGVAPINGAVPDWRGLVPPAGEASESLIKEMLGYSNTLYIATSSTHDTLTISGAEAFYHARGQV